ncbi:MAG: 16S rRNA (cytidine(1402)-2'-O)-methyltransferase [Alphaproteobacteria bacterium]|nr:16S rRNA (cytidine(1402)-2'-O)-methyltransferase [Alphaproteobacteria bacterium]
MTDPDFDNRPNARADAGPDPGAKSGAKSTAGARPIEETAPLPPALYIVATPIGNLRDITLRAIDILRAADLIACEDTRTTARLLSHYGLSKALTAYHDHSDPRRRDALLDRVRQGQAVALVSDAGTPLISDPGFKLVRQAWEDGVRVVPIPGPSSILGALSASGAPTDAFLFAGFPPTKTKARRDFLARWADTPASLIFLESAKRLPACLADMAAVLGDRRAVMAREVTKLFEEFRSSPLAQLAAHYAAEGPPKGEVVLIVDPPVQASQADPEEIDRQLRDALAAGLSTRDAADRVAGETGAKRRTVYQRALALAAPPKAG